MRRIKNAIYSTDKILSLSIIIFSALILPFINSVPYLDGNIDFVQSTDFYRGGFDNYFKNWNSVHPPFKLFLTNLIFSIFGLHPQSYNILGIFCGIIGIIAIFNLSQKIFDIDVARISSLLLAVSPSFLAVGIFGLTDYLLTILLLVALYFYLDEKRLCYTLFASLAILTKETALLLPSAVLVTEIIFVLKKILKGKTLNYKSLFTEFFFYLIPFFIFYAWLLFAKTHGQKAWSDWIFAETAEKGAFYTIFYNLISFNFLNPYAYQHWLQLFFLNFNWIYWLISIIAVITFLIHKKNSKKLYRQVVEGTQQVKVVCIILLFSLTYFLTVLTLQTYTIPRYSLPLVPFLIIATAFALKSLTSLHFLRKIGFTAFFVSISFLSLFFSVDPVSLWLWGSTRILGENVYSLHTYLAGNDGITYNFQYLSIVKKRTDKIYQAKGAVISDECQWIFPDPNNDYKTVKILQLENLNQDPPCKSQ